MRLVHVVFASSISRRDQRLARGHISPASSPQKHYGILRRQIAADIPQKALQGRIVPLSDPLDNGLANAVSRSYRGRERSPTNLGVPCNCQLLLTSRG
jgi:hypothetical protein